MTSLGTLLVSKKHGSIPRCSHRLRATRYGHSQSEKQAYKPSCVHTCAHPYTHDRNIDRSAGVRKTTYSGYPAALENVARLKGARELDRFNGKTPCVTIRHSASHYQA